VCLSGFSRFQNACAKASGFIGLGPDIEQYRKLCLPTKSGCFVSQGVELRVISRTDVGRIGSLGMTRKGVLYYNVPGSGGSNIYTAELASGGTVAKPPVLAIERFINSNGGASISADGKFLAYFVFRPDFESVVAVRDLETGNERDLRPELLGFRDRPVWFPDGRSLLIATYEAPNPGMNLFRLNLATSEEELVLNLAKRAGSFRLSPDGRSLFYVGEPPYEGSWATRLLRYDFDSRREVDLTEDRLGIEEVAVSPDGKQLAYKALLKPGGVRVLAVMPLAGGREKEIFRGPFVLKGNSLEWTPDGKYLLFGKAGENANAPGSLWRVPAVGGPPEPVGLSQPGSIRGPQVHPDGKRLFYTGSEPSREIWALENFIPNTTTTKGAVK
jgi:Tol biopolymer transport system component